MKVKRYDDEDNPFVTITLTKREASILKKLITYNIEDYSNSLGRPVNVPLGSNTTFAHPLYTELENLGVE